MRPTFLASCGKCSATFGYPSLGDFSYGALILSSVDGRYFSYVEAFWEFPTRLATLAGNLGKQLRFWDAVASFADRTENQCWMTGIRCPRCSSANVSLSNDVRCGEVMVPNATFVEAAALSDDTIRERLSIL